MRISDWSSDVCSSDLKKFGVKSGVQTQSGHCIINGQIETGDLPAEAPLEMPMQAFGEQPEARRQVVTSPVGIADRTLLLILSTLTLGLLAASDMTRPCRQYGTSVGVDEMLLLTFSFYDWIDFGVLNAISGFLWVG